MVPAPGYRLGNYELLCPIARGGMAEVWMARLVGTRGFQKPVAIKVMLPAIREDADSERMFLAEASVASRIRHPNVVEILDLGEEEDVLYLVMEWIHGEPLSAVLTAMGPGGRIPFPIGVGIGHQIAMGLHAAHELTDDAGKLLGLVHRDVSPHNVLVGFNGTVKVADFGIAKATADSTNKTEFGVLRGKIAYMAPEQIRFEPLDRRTDTFAAGILLYLLTTGVHPFKRGERHETALAICSSEPVRPPRTFVEKYPERLERVVLRALAKNPAERYATARELGDELLRALPPSPKATGIEELQGFMKEALPERLAYHQDLIRKALASSDSGTSAPRILAIGGPGRSGSTLRAVAVSAAPDPSGTFDVVAPPELAAPAPRPTLAPKRRAKVALTALGGAAIGVIAMVAITGTYRTGSQGSRPEPPTPSSLGAGPVTFPLPASEHAAVGESATSPSRTTVPGRPVELSADAGLPAPAAVPVRPPGPTVPATRAHSPRTTPRIVHEAPRGPGFGLKDPYDSP
jgi:serine/threonine protein kinase